MEPFGLLNLLKSLLPQTENSTPATDETADKKEGIFADNGANSPSYDHAQSSRKDESPPPFAENQETNAFLDFVNRHDERKKQIKK